MKKIALILAVVCVVAIVASCGGSDPNIITASAAKIICTNKAESLSKYDADFSVFDAGTSEQPELWLVRAPGKMQNAYGAWVKITCYCQVSKKNPDPSDRYSPKALLNYQLKQ